MRLMHSHETSPCPTLFGAERCPDAKRPDPALQAACKGSVELIPFVTHCSLEVEGVHRYASSFAHVRFVALLC